MDTDKVIQDLNRRFVAPLPELYQLKGSFWKQACRRSCQRKTFYPAWKDVLKFYLKKLKFPVSK